MKKKEGLLLLTALNLLTSCSCSTIRRNNFGGSSEYVDEVEVVNSGYKKLKTPKTLHDIVEHSYYPTYTPSEGDIKMLALPIIFTNSKIQPGVSFDEAKTNLEHCLFGEASSTGWESVSSFYKKSSFGKLNISGTVASPYMYNGTSNTFQNKILRGQFSVEALLKNALDYYKQNNPNDDLKSYDYDSDGYLDGVYLVYMSEFADGTNEDVSSDVFWAWCSWTNEEPKENETVPGVYFWCSYYFIYEGYGKDALDAHTFIHETGHMLGLEDYYSYNYNSKGVSPSPLGGVDMMDMNIIDHNAFSKFALGWVEPYVIDSEGSLTINKSSTTGECFIIPTGTFNASAFDEYLMVELFSPDNLNYQDLIKGYMPTDPLFEKYGKLDNVGIRMYHVDARLIIAMILGEYIYSDEYVTDLKELDEITLQNVFIAHSNTGRGYDIDGEEAMSYNIGNDVYRLIQAITPEGVDYSSTNKYTSNKSFFYTGGSINLKAQIFYEQFPTKSNKEDSLFNFTSKKDDYTVYANNGDRFLFDFTIDSMSKDACKLTFTKAK